MLKQFFIVVNFSLLLTFSAVAQVHLGIDRFFTASYDKQMKKKKVAIFTNHTGINAEGLTTIEVFQTHAKGNFELTAFFAPEHGLNGSSWAEEKCSSKKSKIPVYSLYGSNRRPTKSMLKNVDVIICDIQDIGTRSYTYISSLFYIMEECAKEKIKVIVLDRPNPLGNLVDGPMLEEEYRSFIGYINIPYCHGMTIGELAQFFNGEYKIGCDLEVVPMEGYKRSMTFKDTHLKWVPTSPNIPESDTPFYYASTGIIGSLELVNIGIGYTLPFKVVGAPWINADLLAKALNSQKIPGVNFMPFQYKPFFGSLKGKVCHGVYIQITDPTTYKPLTVQYLILGVLKSLYPNQVINSLKKMSKTNLDLFCKANGNHKMYEILLKEKYPAWKLIEYDQKKRIDFLLKRNKYLNPSYN